MVDLTRSPRIIPRAWDQMARRRRASDCEKSVSRGTFLFDKAYTFIFYQMVTAQARGSPKRIRRPRILGSQHELVLSLRHVLAAVRPHATRTDTAWGATFHACALDALFSSFDNLIENRFI